MNTRNFNIILGIILSFATSPISSADMLLSAAASGTTIVAGFAYRQLSPSFKLKVQNKISKLVPFMKQPSILQPLYTEFNLPEKYVSLRKELIAILFEHLRKDVQRVRKIQFVGQAGSGKTTFISAYCSQEKLKKRYSIIWKINGDSEENFFTSLNEFLLMRLGRDGIVKLRRQTSELRDEGLCDDKIFLITSFLLFLKTHSIVNQKRWLIFCDNVDDLRPMARYLALFNCENCGNGDMIIATRDINTWPDEQFIKINCIPFTSDQAKIFFRKISSEEVLGRIDNMELLLQHIALLPLDLSLVATHLSIDKSATGSSYLRAYQIHSKAFVHLQQDFSTHTLGYTKEDMPRFRAVESVLDNLTLSVPDISKFLIVITLFYEDNISKTLVKYLYSSLNQDADVDALWLLVQNHLLRNQFAQEHPLFSDRLTMHKSIKPIIRSYALIKTQEKLSGRKDILFTTVLKPLFRTYLTFAMTNVDTFAANTNTKREHYAHNTSFINFWSYAKGEECFIKPFLALQKRLQLYLSGETIRQRFPSSPALLLSPPKIRSIPLQATLPQEHPDIFKRIMIPKLVLGKEGQHLQKSKIKYATIKTRNTVINLPSPQPTSTTHVITSSSLRLEKFPAHLQAPFRKLNIRKIFKEASDLYAQDKFLKAIPLYQKLLHLTREKIKTNPKIGYILGHSLLILGEINYLGRGIEVNMEAAWKLFNQVLHTNGVHTRTQARNKRYLARMHFFGHYISQNFEQSRKLFQMVVKIPKVTDFDSGQSNHFLGIIFFYGLGTVKNQTHAYDFFKTIVETTPCADPDSLSEAKRFLGMMHYFGLGATIDYVKARRLLSASINTAHTTNISPGMAKCLLGKIHYFGLRVAIDYSYAHELFSATLRMDKAISSSLAVAYYFLGEMNYFGRGISVDYNAAYHFFSSVITLKNVDRALIAQAKFFLGEINQHGLGRDVNKTRAKILFHQAILTPAGLNEEMKIRAQKYLQGDTRLHIPTSTLYFV